VLLLHCKTVGRERQEGENLWGKKREREKERRETDNFWRSDMLWSVS